MFEKCKNLINIESLKNWDVSNCKDFSKMFKKCKNLSNIESLKNWKVLNTTQFSGMFAESQILNLDVLNNWNISEEIKNSMLK